MRDRGIIVQIEIWDRFDHSGDPWQDDPFNPKNNINYDEDESGLAPDYPQHPGQNQRPLFYTVLGLEGNQVILKWQQAFVDRILSFAFQYDHVLYCVDNETSGDPAWGRYWARAVGEVVVMGIDSATIGAAKSIPSTRVDRVRMINSIRGCWEPFPINDRVLQRRRLRGEQDAVIQLAISARTPAEGGRAR